MKFSEDLSTRSLNVITGINAGYVVVQNKKINSSHVIAPDALVSWSIKTFTEMTADHLSKIIKLNPEVIILGTGSDHILPEKSILKALVETGVGYEVMSTPAACRTYNILLAEDRRAVVGLVI